MKSLITALFLLGTGMSVFAQGYFKAGIIAHPFTTVMMNKTDGEKPDTEYLSKLTWGMSGGLLAAYQVNERVGISMNALYSLQGQQYTKENYKEEEVLCVNRLHYIKLPLYFSYTSGTIDSKLRFNANVGPQVSFLIRAQYRDDDQSVTPDMYATTYLDYPDPIDRYKYLNLAVAGQVGMDIRLTYNIYANIAIRGDYGLNDTEYKDADFKLFSNGITSRQYLYPEDRAKTHNITAGLLFGMSYHFMK